MTPHEEIRALITDILNKLTTKSEDLHGTIWVGEYYSLADLVHDLRKLETG